MDCNGLIFTRTVYITKSGTGVIILPISLVRYCMLESKHWINVVFVLPSKRDHIEYVCSLSKNKKQFFVIIPKVLVTIVFKNKKNIVSIKGCNIKGRCYLLIDIPK